MTKLIIEKDVHDIYAYIENDAQYEKTKKYRLASKELPVATLYKECALSLLPKNSFIVFELASAKPAKKKPAKKKKKTRGK